MNIWTINDRIKQTFKILKDNIWIYLWINIVFISIELIFFWFMIYLFYILWYISVIEKIILHNYDSIAYSIVYMILFIVVFFMFISWFTKAILFVANFKLTQDILDSNKQKFIYYIKESFKNIYKKAIIDVWYNLIIVWMIVCVFIIIWLSTMINYLVILFPIWFIILTYLMVIYYFYDYHSFYNQKFSFNFFIKWKEITKNKIWAIVWNILLITLIIYVINNIVANIITNLVWLSTDTIIITIIVNYILWSITWAFYFIYFYLYYLYIIKQETKTDKQLTENKKSEIEI